MNDVDLIADLVRAGVSADLVGRVVNEITSVLASAEVRGHSAEKRSRPAIKYEARRESDRLRKQAKREKSKVNPEANDAGSTSKSSAGLSADIPRTEIAPPSLTSFLPSSSGDLFTSKQGRKTEVVARQDRGTRLPSDWKMSLALIALCAEYGVNAAEFETEFKDFWVGVPGARGRKCDWEATARNRIKEIGKRRKGNGHAGGIKSAFDELRLDLVRYEEESRPPMRDITPTKPRSG